MASVPDEPFPVADLGPPAEVGPDAALGPADPRPGAPDQPDHGRDPDPLASLRAVAGAPPRGWLEAARTAGVRFLAAPAAVRGQDPPRRGARVGLVALGLAVLAGGALVVGLALGGRSSEGPPAGTSSLPFASGSATTTAPTGAPTSSGSAGSGDPTPPGELVVQAAGAVGRPGVYHLPAGARVGDLVEAAGGLAADADGDRLNLASPLADGARVYVPRHGESDPPGPVVGGGGSPAAGPGGAGPSSSVPASVDLNTATASELEALPGIGPATAAAIIDHRQRHGPFRSVDELADVRGIGDAKLAQLRGLVHV